MNILHEQLQKIPFNVFFAFATIFVLALVTIFVITNDILIFGFLLPAATLLVVAGVLKVTGIRGMTWIDGDSIGIVLYANLISSLVVFGHPNSELTILSLLLFGFMWLAIMLMLPVMYVVFWTVDTVLLRLGVIQERTFEQ